MSEKKAKRGRPVAQMEKLPAGVEQIAAVLFWGADKDKRPPAKKD